MEESNCFPDDNGAEHFVYNEKTANSRRGSFVTQRRYDELRLSFLQAVIFLILIISSLVKLLSYEVPSEENPVWSIFCQLGLVIYCFPAHIYGHFIFTNDRLFMSPMGPGSSVNTQVIFAMLGSTTIRRSKPRKTYYFLHGISAIL